MPKMINAYAYVAGKYKIVPQKLYHTFNDIGKIKKKKYNIKW